MCFKSLNKITFIAKRTNFLSIFSPDDDVKIFNHQSIILLESPTYLKHLLIILTIKMSIYLIVLLLKVMVEQWREAESLCKRE
jgi:hypothetical protein